MTTSTENKTIVVEGLKKSYGTLKVLDGIDFSVKRGEILALLGPNGAGKTTTVKILSTLLSPDAGRATVNGFDLEREADRVRASIGLTGQYAAVDEYLTGRENIEMIGRLYRLPGHVAQKRADELLERFDLIEAAGRPVKTYSGGMRRRIDLAMSLIASPPVLFLDEPTTGLDPRSRLTMWQIVKDLAATDVTILLTTQYMEEADNLSDRIIVIDHGKVIAEGTPPELKAQVGSDHLELIVSEPHSVEKAAQAIRLDSLRIDIKRRSLTIPTKNGPEDLKKVLGLLEESGIAIESLSLHRPTLDDVFLTLTGHATAEAVEETISK
jgi:ABC-2 type transport system ATP-binding protein